MANEGMFQVLDYRSVLLWRYICYGQIYLLAPIQGAIQTPAQTTPNQ